jgi:hypothetical protein
MSHPTAGAQYAFSDADLNTIINGTNDAISSLHSVNSRVQGTGQEASTVNRSDSGGRMDTRLYEWMTDFHKLIGDLTSLNSKAEGLRRANLNAAHEATEIANSGH